MTMLLIAHHLSSAAVVLSCWWLAHAETRVIPPGRMIAAGYALVGFSVLFTAVVRQADPFSDDAVSWMSIVSKIGIAATFVLVSYRRIKIGQVANR